MKYYFLLAVLSIGMLSSCTKEEDAIHVEPGELKYEIKDSDDPSEHFIYEFYQETSSVILYSYDRSDYLWNLRTNDDFKFEVVKHEDLKDALAVAKKVFLDIYSRDFAKEYFPTKILLSSEVTGIDENYKDFTGEVASNVNFLVIGQLDDKAKDLTEAQILNLKAKVNADFWSKYLVARGKFSIPDSYKEISDHHGEMLMYIGGWSPDATPYEFGFIDVIAEPWGDFLPTQEQDLQHYMEFIFSHNEEEIAEMSSKNGKIKEKFEILFNEIKEQTGFDVKKFK